MPTQHFTVHLPVHPASVEALLATYPTTWLRRFLRLASISASARPGSPEAPGLYRLHHLDPLDGAQPARAAVTWWPHAGDGLFACFRGHFLVHELDGGASLGLAGETDGGDHATNAAVLRSVVELIGAAVRAGHAPEG
ncbi:MAG: hypothetical protein ABL966_01780 [Acidimicrobiales bacterium]